MTENSNDVALGRKIFFLYPPGLIQNQVMAELVQEEFEVYIVKDEVKLRQLLKKSPGSIVFACINEGMKENAWEEWITGVMADSEISGLDIGIIASGADENLRRKYMMQIKVRCGFTVLRPDLNGVIKQLVEILNSAEAKGRRKFLRVIMDKDANTTVNLPMNGTFINGVIKDISVVGFSCSFAEDPGLTKNKLVGDIQIRLQSQLFKAEGIVFGSRAAENEKIYVFLFTQRISPDVKTRIRKYIQSSLQNRMDDELKAVPKN